MRYVLLFIIASIAVGCAMVVAPTGGAKDTQPPALIRSNPDTGTVYFDSKKIILEFDEFVQLKDVGQQIVISPPMSELPDMEVSGKNVIVRIRDTLMKHTTYTINFGNAIVDLHEQNALSGFTYVFSTGSYIDSFSVSGSCLQSFTKQTDKDFLVGLYPDSSFTDSTVFKQKPSYFTKSLPDGKFTINNLPDALFRLVAFSDLNKNLLFDANERIAFLENPLKTPDSIQNTYSLFTFSPAQFKQNSWVDTLTRFAGRFTLVIYNKDGLSVESANEKKVYSRFVLGSNGFDSIQVFIADTATDASLRILTADTAYNAIIPKSKYTQLPPLDVKLDRSVELNDSMHISFSNPISIVDTSKIYLMEDTIRVLYTFIKNDFAFHIKYPWQEGKKYTLKIKDSACFDLFKQYSKKQDVTWTARTIKDYANLQLTLTGVKPNSRYILQLWNDDEKEMKYAYTISQDTVLVIPYMLPGTLKIKTIEDVNKNGIWDNGDFYKQKQPERVGYIKEPIILRAYWDLEVLINIIDMFK